MQMIRMAFRNITRNWHRTLVTILAMAFAGFIMILFASLMEGMLQASERNAVIMDVGDIQIHAKGFRDDPDLYTRIDEPERLIAEIEGLGLNATQRLYAFGLAASGAASAGVQLRGINVSSERKVTQIDRHVMTGTWLHEEDLEGVVIGRRLARTLGIGVGDELIFLGQAADGAMANALYHVRGILKSVGEGIDRSGIFMPEAVFRALMALPEGTHEIAVMRPGRRGDLDAAKMQVVALAGNEETLDWRELRPVIARLLEMADTQTIIMIIITYIAVAMVVLNAMLMGVFERIREFGIMKAIGVQPLQIVGLIYMETLIQVMLAAAFALASGWMVSLYFQENGIDLTHIATSVSIGGIALDPIWRAHVTVETLWTPIIFLIVMALLSVAYPALKAALVQPVKAIHAQ